MPEQSLVRFQVLVAVFRFEQRVRCETNKIWRPEGQIEDAQFCFN